MQILHCGSFVSLRNLIESNYLTFIFMYDDLVYPLLYNQLFVVLIFTYFMVFKIRLGLEN